MRVIHLIKATGVAGAERHLLDLLPGLRARGCDARLLVLVERRRPADEFLEEARRRGVPAGREVIGGDVDPLLCARLALRLRRERPALLHTHLIHADLHGLAAARLARGPEVVTTRHNDDPFRRRWPVRPLLRLCWRGVAGGIAVSRAVRHFSREAEGAPATLPVVHHGIAPPESEDREAVRASLGLDRGALVAGMLCRLTAQKGAADGLAAFAAAARAHPGAILLLAGDGPERAALERRAALLGIGERTRFLGWRDDANRILWALDVLIAPSRWEGFGLVVLEAMARGVAVLATRAGALPELVADGETGLLAAPGDVEALAAGLARLLGDAGLRARLGAAGRERARERFGLARMVAETLAVYERALRDAGGTA
ncbi:MAG: glycosyltransferase [Candidatus Eisenbacteria bacterium]|uniref:Glycosyltransferase n=1 Tax=Eiseniibacteriota bacterium TaxID=2212470 RepID=A0A937XEF9_UNCEI|nr:glycosyltransferase [Candidatus Eisenbacteria bacterium]